MLQTLFSASIIIKCIDGLIELAGGLSFIILDTDTIVEMWSRLLHYNLFHIHNVEILKLVTAASNALTTNVKVFISTILICNGFAKVTMAVPLFFRKLYAFPISLIFLVILLIYSIVQTFYTPSIYLTLFNIFDAAVILVIWLEYLHLKKTKKFH